MSCFECRESVMIMSALRAEAANGVLSYNELWDTHLNREGSQLVGEVIAQRLESASFAGGESG